MADDNKTAKYENPDFATALAQLQEAIPGVGKYMTDIDVAVCNATNDGGSLIPSWGKGCEAKREIVKNR